MKKINTENNFIFFTATLVCVLLASAVVGSSPASENYRLIQAVLLLSQLVAYFSLNLSRQWRGFVALILALMYLISLEYWPQGINGMEYRDWHDNLSTAIYFSFITMTSTGYGDITPALPVTQTLAYLQAIAGTFYVAVVVASLVSAFSRAEKINRGRTREYYG